MKHDDDVSSGGEGETVARFLCSASAFLYAISLYNTPFSSCSELDKVLNMIVCQGNRLFGQGLTVEGQFTSSVCGQTVDRDVINGLPVAIMNLVAGPACRKTRSDSQAIALEMDAEQCFCEESVHPAG